MFGLYAGGAVHTTCHASSPAVLLRFFLRGCVTVLPDTACPVLVDPESGAHISLCRVKGRTAGVWGWGQILQAGVGPVPCLQAPCHVCAPTARLIWSNSVSKMLLARSGQPPHGDKGGLLQVSKASSRMRSGASWRHRPSLQTQLTANPDDPFALLSLPSAGGSLLSWGSLNPQVGSLQHTTQGS